MCRTCGKRHNSYDTDPSSGGTQDVSLEAVGSIPFSFGLRSPGKVSPLRGRNMKEYEEHLEHLKKENFALKLRIYFLEERMGQKGMKEDKDDLYKANIELKVETEALKKELWDKQELVRQASALLTTLEHQYKDQLHQAKENHERDTEDLKAKIFVLEKEVEDYSERCRHEGGDLTQLCGLAFCTGEEGNSMVPGHQNANIAMRNLPYMGSTSPLQGIFSLQDNVATPAIERNYCNNPLMISNMNNQEEEEYIPDSAKRRIRLLEGEVENLKCKVEDLQKELGDKERTSLALEEDISNLKKEIAEREDKMIDLETEVNEKDQKVDQLMQELETRHLEIQAKDSKIQTLHDDLNKVEPEIEIKVQEIIERDKIIEEKIEQLQQQNKILVEIQITLDEKQKQIAELEANLLDAQQKVEKLNKDFELSLATIQGLADEVMSRDKEILQLKKELKKKEKKVRDLVAELKEALDMLKKAKWEAETSGGEDGVKEMVEEENERLWAELEQRKLELMTLKEQKATMLKESEDKIEDLKKRGEETENKLRALLIEMESREKVENACGEIDKEFGRENETEILTLKEKVESRDGLLRSQQGLINNLKGELSNLRDELVEKKNEMKELKTELSKKSLDVQEFFAKELLGRSDQVKELQGKLCDFTLGHDKQLKALKLIMEANKLKSEAKESPSKTFFQVQVRSNSLSQLDQPIPNTSDKNDKDSFQPSSKAGRSNSFSLLENALYANMGQKVYNTNQTFNTYVLSGETENKSGETNPQNDISLAAVLPKEAFQLEANSKNEALNILAKPLLLSSDSKPLHVSSGYKPIHVSSVNKSLHVSSDKKPLHVSAENKPLHASSDISAPMDKIANKGTSKNLLGYNVEDLENLSHPATISENLSHPAIISENLSHPATISENLSHPATISENANNSNNSIQLLYQEISKIRCEAQALRREREMLSDKLTSLQKLNDQVCGKCGDSEDSNEIQNQMDVLKKQLEESKEEHHLKDQVHEEIVSDFQIQIDTLKDELKEAKKKITIQILDMASRKFQNSLRNYKQEITSLRKRLTDSHNACDLLRNRLEELVDFLEQILEMDKTGIISLSHLSPASRLSLQKTLDDSRALSLSLSHSLMIGTDSLLQDTTNVNNETSMFNLPLDNLPEEIDLSQFGFSPSKEPCIRTDLTTFDFSLDITADDEFSNCDSIYHSLAAKINSQIDSKTQEIDSIAIKLSHLNAVIQKKDDTLREQMDIITNLQTEVNKLKKEIRVKDGLLKEKSFNVSKASIDATTPSKDRTSLYGSVSQLQDDTNSSLHLSALQHSIALTYDMEIHKGIFTVPEIQTENSSSSDTLPPPPLFFSSQEDCRSLKFNECQSSQGNSEYQKPFSDHSDTSNIRSAYSTDVVVKTMPKMCDESPTTKVASEIKPLQGMFLEQPQLPPSFALASPSESEAWSEPDRNVSLARIGLDACTLVSANHDRSLSRSRMTRSAPFTSESDGEGNHEDTKEGSAGQGGTPSNKPKRRSDAAEVKRLSSKLRTVEQLNETLRAELHIYQTLSQQFGTPLSNSSFQLNRPTSIKPLTSEKGVSTLNIDMDSSLNESPLSETPCSLMIPSSLLQEIRSLRIKLEEAITNNDLLRDQLEAALAGYLNEETRNLTIKLTAAQQELKLNQEQLIIAANTEKQLRNQFKESESKTFELSDRLAEYMTNGQQLENKVGEMKEKLKDSKDALRRAEEELRSFRLMREERDSELKKLKDAKLQQMEEEISLFKEEILKLQQRQQDKEREIDEQKKYICGLEEAKSDYESRLSEQDSAINDLCQSITKLQQENKSSETDQIVIKLQEALQHSESHLLQVTKERFALVGERARLHAQLASVTTQAELLQRGMRELSASDESLQPDIEYDRVMQRLKKSQTTIKELQKEREIFSSEKHAMQKEMQLLQEEISALRSHLDHVLSRETVTNSREIRELASLQISYKNIQEQYSSLQNSCKTLQAEKLRTENKLKEVQRKENEIEKLQNKLKEEECRGKEITSQLEAERFLTRNLQIQITNLQTNQTRTYEVPPSESHDSASASSATNTDFILRTEKSLFKHPSRSLGDRNSHSSLSIHWSENKENYFPPAVYNENQRRKNLSLPHLEDDVTSGESQDLGIGSDGTLSSLERIGGKVLKQFYLQGHKDEKGVTLCSEPSHSQLFSEIEHLRQEKEDLTTKLSSTKETLQEALDQLSKANSRKESVERAICRQLSKTHDVLKKAKGNLRQANKASSQTRAPGNGQLPSTSNRTEEFRLK